MTDDVKPDATITAPANTKTESFVGMKDKDIKWRAKYKETFNELETVKAAAERKQRELESQITEVAKARELSETRRIEAEVKALAVAEGLNDLDLVKLIDITGLKIDANGEIIGAKEAITDFKSKKPAFFGQQKKTSTSTNASVPGEVKTQSPSAYDISDSDWKAVMRRAQITSM